MGKRRKKKKGVGEFSFQARIKDPKACLGLDSLGPFYSSLTRHLFADLNKETLTTKPLYCASLEILARQFNGCKVEADARYKNALENYKFQLDNLPIRIQAIEEDLEKLEDKFTIHQKKRRWYHLSKQQEALEKKIKEENISCVFGSKKLWLAQFNLEANNYKSHEAWRKDWIAHRDYNFQVVGSYDETMGNGMCQLIQKENRFWNLQLRLPKNSPEKYLIIPGIKFNSDNEESYQTLLKVYLQNKNKELRQSIAFRFHKDKKGWIVTLTTRVSPVEVKTNINNGVIGVDTNPDHLAYMEIDRFGNPLPNGQAGKGQIFFNLKGDADFDLNAIQHSAIELVDLALRTGKSLVIEKLDFKKKLAQLEAMHGPAYAKMLSSFAYSAIVEAILSRAYKMGVEVRQVNSAYSSLIGNFKYTKKYGLTSHLAAALVIGRRCFRLSERLPQLASDYHQISVGRYQVTLEKPVDSSKHVWSSWAKVQRQMQKQLRELRGQSKLEFRRKLKQKSRRTLKLELKSKRRAMSKDIDPQKLVPSDLTITGEQGNEKNLQSCGDDASPLQLRSASNPEKAVPFRVSTSRDDTLGQRVKYGHQH